MFKTPCEIALWNTLPSIRKELVIYLVNEKKIPRKDVAKMLGITESAISQYLKNKRGGKLTVKQKTAIKRIGNKMIKEKKYTNKLFSKYMCKICSEVVGVCK